MEVDIAKLHPEALLGFGARGFKTSRVPYPEFRKDLKSRSPILRPWLLTGTLWEAP